MPNTLYYVKQGSLPSNTTWAYIVFYDASENNLGIRTSAYGAFTTPSEARYLRVGFNPSYGTTYKGDICINLSSSKNGTYEPYQKNSYALDSSLTLRGILKMDSDHNLFYDGDVYGSDGVVHRYWGERAYQSGDASDGSTMITDGTRTVYKLTTPTTETADPYQNPQIVIKGGTEEYVTDSIIPVGHETDYYLDADSVLTPPDTSGTYTLKVTVASDGSKSYSWESDS